VAEVFCGWAKASKKDLQEEEGKSATSSFAGLRQEPQKQLSGVRPQSPRTLLTLLYLFVTFHLVVILYLPPPNTPHELTRFSNSRAGPLPSPFLSGGGLSSSSIHFGKLRTLFLTAHAGVEDGGRGPCGLTPEGCLAVAWVASFSLILLAFAVASRAGGPSLPS
jgi:hypothetical protein